VLPGSYLDTLVLCPEMWNHYAATFLKLRLPYKRVRCDRGHRLAGRSRMNFVSLVVHGISAVFANQEVVGTRLLLMTLGASVGFLLMIAAVVAASVIAHKAIPGWAILTAVVLLLIVVQLLLGSFMLIFFVMMTRSHLGFLPIRDYSYFVADETTLYSAPPIAESAVERAAGTF
jgi:polyisoprenyl-phosphate glycosyltransferase